MNQKHQPQEVWVKYNEEISCTRHPEASQWPGANSRPLTCLTGHFGKSWFIWMWIYHGDSNAASPWHRKISWVSFGHYHMFDLANRGINWHIKLELDTSNLLLYCQRNYDYRTNTSYQYIVSIYTYTYTSCENTSVAVYVWFILSHWQLLFIVPDLRYAKRYLSWKV